MTNTRELYNNFCVLLFNQYKRFRKLKYAAEKKTKETKTK